MSRLSHRITAVVVGVFAISTLTRATADPFKSVSGSRPDQTFKCSDFGSAKYENVEGCQKFCAQLVDQDSVPTVGNSDRCLGVTAPALIGCLEQWLKTYQCKYGEFPPQPPTSTTTGTVSPPMTTTEATQVTSTTPATTIPTVSATTFPVIATSSESISTDSSPVDSSTADSVSPSSTESSSGASSTTEEEGDNNAMLLTAGAAGGAALLMAAGGLAYRRMASSSVSPTIEAEFADSFEDVSAEERRTVLILGDNNTFV